MEVASSNRIDINQRPASLSADSLAERYSKEEGTMERRTFIGAVTGASLGLPIGAPGQRICASAKHNANRSWSQFFRDLSSRAFRNHDFGASLRKRAGNSDGARLPAHKPDVAILAPKLAENHTVIFVDLA